MDKIKKIFKHGDKDETEEIAHEPSPHAERAAKTALADAYGAPGASQQLETKPDVEKKEHGILSQITNPDGKKHDDIRFGETATAVPGTTLSRLQEVGGGGSNMSVLSGVIGPYASNADKSLQAASSSTAATESSNLGHGAGSSTTATESSKLGHGADSSAAPALSSVQPGTALTTDQPLMSSSNTSTQPQTETSHIGRDTALGGAAATGLGGAGYAASKDHHDTTQSSTTTGLGQQTGTTSALPTTSSISKDTPKDDVSAATYTDRSFPLSNTSPKAPETGSLAGGSVRPDPSASTAGDSSHLGRDAAIGTGIGASALAAGGMAHHSKDRDGDLSTGTENSRSFPLGGGATQTSGAGTTAPLSGTTTDPTNIAGTTSSNTGLTSGSGSTGLASTGGASDVRQLANQEVGNTSTSSHVGRDSAIAGAGAGAVGAGTLAAYEKEHEPKPDIAAATYTARSYPVGRSSAEEARSILPASTQSVPPLGGHRDDEKPVEGYLHHTPGPHATDIANRLDPHVPGEFPTEEGLDPHAGTTAASLTSVAPRDQPIIGQSSSQPAASNTQSSSGLGAAAGAAGLGTVAASMAAAAPGTHGSSTSQTAQQPVTQTSPSTGRHPSELMGMPADSTAPQPASDRHAIRHASISAGTAGAGAAGVGAAAYEANKRDQPADIGFSSGSPPKDFISRPVEPASSSAGARRPSQTSRAAPAPVSGTNLTSSSAPHPSELMAKPINEQPQAESHTGRNAALGAGAGLGAAGLGAAGYEAYKSHQDPTASTQQPLGSAAPLSGSTAGQPSTTLGSQQPLGSTAAQPSTTLGSQPPVSSNTAQTSTLPSAAQQAPESTSHTGRNAALGGLGGAGVGAAGYEAYKHHEQPSATSATQPLASQGTAPSSSAIGHGDQEPAIKTTTNHRLSQSSGTAAPLSSGQPGNIGDQQQHHYGRDAALGAGGVGVAGVGAHELSKSHDKDVAQQAPVTSSSTQPQSTHQHHHHHEHKDKHAENVDPKKSTEKEHHHGRDAAAVGGTGAAGVGAYELAQHEKDKHASDTTGESSDHHHKEHNKLHKRTDPRSDKYVPPEEEEKKPSLLKRILHPHSSKEKSDDDSHTSSIPGMPSRAGAGTLSNLSDQEQSKDGMVTEPHTGLPMNVGKYGTDAVEHRSGTDGPIGDATKVSGTTHAQPGDPGVVVEKHTGLPMNVGKYGSGAGGTDGAPIEGATTEGVTVPQHETQTKGMNLQM